MMKISFDMNDLLRESKVHVLSDTKHKLGCRPIKSSSGFVEYFQNSPR